MHALRTFVLAAFASVALGTTLVPAATAQGQGPYVIQGTVRDAQSQQPLADVSVTLRGVGRAVFTDSRGRYSLLAQVPAGTYELQFTFLGRRRVVQTVQLGTSLTVEVPPVGLALTAVQLDEVIVTGVGAPAERRVLGNTIETVSGEEVSEAPGASAIDQALQGKITGALISEHSGEPGGGVSIRLRGTNSILGGAEPLYVVDGVFVDNSNAALVSLGANAGRGNAALTNRLADLDPADIERIEVLKGAAAAALYGSRANNGVIQIFTRRGRAGDAQVRFLSEFSANVTPKRYELMQEPLATIADVTWGGAGSVGATVSRTDIQDQIWRTGFSSVNRLSVSGGSPNTQYYFAGSYGYEQGILQANDYERLSLRANVTQQVSDRVELSLRGSYMQSEANFVIGGEQTSGVLTSVIFTPNSFDPNFDEVLGRYPYNPILGVNPLDVLDNWDAPEKVNRFQGSAEIRVEPVRNLTVRYVIGLDDYRQVSRLFEPPASRSASYTGLIQNPIRISRQFNNDITVTHVGQLSPSIGLTSTLGFRYTNDRGEVVSASARDLPPEQTLVGGATQFASQSISEFRTMDWFLEERVSLNDQLYLSGGVNLDASSAFGTDERWQLFPRVSLSYVIGETDFWRNSLGGTVSSMRLRAAYGQTGGQPPGLYSRFENYFDVAYGGLPGLVPSNTAGNPDLKPERQREFEFGLDAGVFDDRAQLEFTYYNKKTTDLVLEVPLPPSLGVQNQFQNIGELRNKGWEAALTTVNVSTPTFSWRTRLQLAANRNKIEKLVTATDTLVSNTYLNAVVEGQPIGVFYGGIYARTPDGGIAYDAASLPIRARDTLPDGSTPFARRIIGDPNPDLIASLSSTVAIGQNVQVSFLLDGRFGNDVANFTRRISEYFGADRIVDREVTGDTIPRTFALNPNGRINVYEEYVEDGTFVRLREVAVQFRFDQPFVRRIGAESLTLRLAGRNLLTFTGYRGLDPEVNMFSASTVSRGVDFATTPLPRTFTFSLGLNF